MKINTRQIQALATFALLSISIAAHAYVGPGSALGVIGSIIATIAVVILAIFGLILYPFKLIKQRLNKKKDNRQANQEDTDSPEEQEQ